jgi:putative heme iron utilization protein
MKKQANIFEAKNLVRQQHSGVLSTHSQAVEGYPFGSIVPYYMTAQGNLVIYISQIAQHTRNIKSDHKVSLTVFDDLADDSQASGRVTLLGDAQLITDEEIANQYFALFEQAEGYQKTHDFTFYQINIQRVRYIGGFGKIHWISQDDWGLDTPDWQHISCGIVEHMNEDHQDAMQLILKHKYYIDAEQVTMISAFCEGVHLCADSNIYYLPFDSLCITSMLVREQLVKATHEARAALTPKAG